MFKTVLMFVALTVVSSAVGAVVSVSVTEYLKQRKMKAPNV
jgi:hypothetical protein